MAHQFTTSYLKDAIDLFRYYKRLGDNAIAQCPDDKLCAEIDPESEFYRDYCEAYGGQHAFAVEQFSDDGWGEAGPAAGYGV